MKLRRIAYAALAVALSSAAYFGAATVAAYTAPPATQSAAVKVVMETGHGSGVHIGDGFVLTAAHVIRDARSAQLLTKDGQSRQADVL